MNSTARRAVFGLACLVHAPSIARHRNRRSILVLCYHGLKEDSSQRSSWLLLARSEFARQMRYVARHYRVLPIDDALDEPQTALPAKPVACITFDDGYRNNYTLALPILRELRLRATIYLATGLIGTSRRLWTTQLQLALAQSPRRTVTLETLGLGTAPLGSAGEREALAGVLMEQLKCMAATERGHALERLLADLAVPEVHDGGDFSLMSWAEAQEMSASGLITFGGHTVNHEIVARLQDDAVEREVGESVAAVRSSGVAVSDTFAYPNGRSADFDSRSRRAVEASGCRAALTTIEGLNPPDADRFELRRVLVGGDMSFDDFRVRTSGLVSAAKDLAGRGS